MFRMLIHPSSGACDLFVELFHGLCCSGSMRVGVTVWFDWGSVVPLCRLKLCFSLHKNTTPPQPNHNVTPTHIEPEQYTHTQSQAPEDECTSIRNMLSKNKSSKRQLVYLYSTSYERVYISECLPNWSCVNPQIQKQCERQ